MDKQFLISFIDKYYLKGLTEKVKWVVKDKVLTLDFLSATGNLVGKIEVPNFEMTDGEVSIFDTTQLLKLLGVTTTFITLTIKDEFATATKLLIEDNEFSLEYTLAMSSLIKPVPQVEEPDYNFGFDLDKDFVDKFIKAKKGVESTNISISSVSDKTGSKVKFVLGENNKHSNKVIFEHPVAGLEKCKAQHFDSDCLREIFNANKDIKEGKFFFNDEGIVKLQFENETGQKVSYFLIAKEDDK